MQRKNLRALVAAVAALLPAIAHAGTTTNTVTVSISGSTAMRNFTIDPRFTLLSAGTTLTLGNGSYGPAGGSGLQLAVNANASAPTPFGTGAAAGGVRVEWHEAGSIEGILELSNDQIGYTGAQIVDPLTTRNPTALNPIRVNRNNNTATGLNGVFGVSSSTYDTYNTGTSGYTSGGTNLAGGQDRVQWAISDVPARQGFSTTGTSNPFATPATAGYGKGNTNLTTVGNFGANTRQPLVDVSVLNMPTTKVDPATGANYNAGAWNTAGIDNLISKTVAITATTFSANPGTGLTSLNRSDAQMLQTAGRLPNGVDFNVASRDVNSGTRNVGALNTGIDPSFASGENDAGNGFNTTTISSANSFGTDARAQASIGPAIQFSGKAAGGGQLRPTLHNARMALGTLSLPDSRTGAANASTANPLRALSFSNSTYNSNYADGSFTAVAPSAATLTDGSYAIWQQQQYVFVKRPDAGYTNTNAYKGDSTAGVLQTGNSTGDAFAISNNILASVGTVNTAGQTPADGLLATGFILPQFMIVAKTVDGGATSDISANVNPGYLNQTNAQLRNTFITTPSLTGAFSVIDPAAQTVGNNGSFYGVASSTDTNGVTASTVVGALYTGANRINITANNYLFGNFNQNGIRDFSALKSATSAQAALFTTFGVNGTDMYSSVGNTSTVTGLTGALATMAGQTGVANTLNANAGASKGDLIVMGDYNGDGRFNGRDLYSFAFGGAIADTIGGDTVAVAGTLGSATFNNNFSTKLRTASLVKNAALDYLQTNATAQQKIDATASVVNDPTGANAFNKRDVNRDGLVSFNDALVVDKLAGLDYTSVADQTQATISTDGKPNGASQVAISLIAAKLVDTAVTSASARPVQQADADVINPSFTNTVVNQNWTGATVKSGSLALALRPATGSTITVASTDTLTVSGGSLTVSANNTPTNVVSPLDNAANTTGLNVTVSGGSLKVDHAFADRNNGSIAPVTVLNSLTVAGGLVNLTTSDLIVKGGSTAASLNAAVGTYLTSGGVSGLGTDSVFSGKTSFTATGFTGLAVFSNNDSGNNYYTTYNGVALAPTDTIVKFTFWGDLNVDGDIDGDDLATLIETLSTTGVGNYQQGDLTYDGLVNAADINRFFLTQSNASVFGSGLSFGDGNANGPVGGAIPEPSALGLLVAALPLVTRRRRA